MGRAIPGQPSGRHDLRAEPYEESEVTTRDQRRKTFLRHILAVRHQEKRGGLGEPAREHLSAKPSPPPSKLYGSGEAHVSDILYYLALCDVSGSPCTMGDVNKGAAVPRSSAHRLISQLIADGVVRKEQSNRDRRFTTLRLSEDFRCLLLTRIDTIMAQSGFLSLLDPANQSRSEHLSDEAVSSSQPIGRAVYVDREIRDALNVISGFAELLLDPVMGLSDISRHRSDVEIIHRAAMRLNIDRESIFQNLQADRVPVDIYNFIKPDGRH